MQTCKTFESSAILITVPKIFIHNNESLLGPGMYRSLIIFLSLALIEVNNIAMSEDSPTETPASRERTALEALSKKEEEEEKESDDLPSWLTGKNKKVEPALSEDIGSRKHQAESVPIASKKKPDAILVAEPVIEPTPVAETQVEPDPVVTSIKNISPPTPKGAKASSISKDASADLVATKGFFHSKKTNRYFNNGKTPLALRMAKNSKELQTITVSVNDQGYIPYPGILNIENEGFNHINFRATDHTGKETPIQDFKIYVDKTPPTLNSYWHGPNIQESQQLLVSGNSLLSISAQDALSGPSKIVIEEDGNKKIYKGPMKFADGKHSIQYYAIDNVGNESAPTNLDFTVDSTPPQTKATIKGVAYKNGKTNYVSPDAQIVLEAAEASSGIDRIEYKINDGSIATYHSPIHVLDSKMELKYRSIDKSGNIEDSTSMLLVADTTPPAIKLGPHGDYILKGNRILAQTGFNIYIDAKDVESGIAEVLVSMDGKNFEKTNERNIIFDKPGEFHFSVRVIDRIENLKESNSYVVLISDEGSKALLPDN